MAVDVVRLRDSEFALRRTGDEFRAGILLRCASWHQKPASSVPNDDVLLAFLAGFGRDVEAWLRVRDGALDGFIECSDGRLYHPEIAEKALEAEKQRDINRARTTAATDARRRQRDEDRHDQRQDDCDDHQRNKAKEKVKGTKPTPTQTEERVTAATDGKAAAPPPETLSQFSGSVLKEAGAPGKAPASIMGTELPADWMPSDELCEEVKRDFCMNYADLQAEVPAFHALNAQGGKLSRDWNATFRLFCKRWKEHRDKKATPRVGATKQSNPVNSALYTPTEADWDSAVKFFAKTGRWSMQFGPEPSSRACRCPKHILEKHNIDPDTAEKRRPACLIEG
jgi:hypothetical protein